MRNILFSMMILAAALGISTAAHADDYVLTDDYLLTLKNHQFTPNELTVPANQKISLIVKNQDATPAEFESGDLGREKVVGANSEITLRLGPLDPGTYAYYDDFHRKTTTGTLIVK